MHFKSSKANLIGGNSLQVPDQNSPSSSSTEVYNLLLSHSDLNLCPAVYAVHEAVVCYISVDPKDINSVCDSERLLLGLEMNREIKELAGSQKHLTGNEVYPPPPMASYSLIGP